MTGIAQQVLKITKKLKEVDEKTIRRALTVSMDCVARLCDTLVEEGFLSRTDRGEYVLTDKGENAVGGSIETQEGSSPSKKGYEGPPRKLGPPGRNFRDRYPQDRLLNPPGESGTPGRYRDRYA